jgi:adenosylcobyric acid synthase
MGQTNIASAVRPVFRILEEMGRLTERLDGAQSEDGLVWGTYLHGVFDTQTFRRDFLDTLRKSRGWVPLEVTKSKSPAETSDLLAALIRKHVDLAALEQILNMKL